MVKDTVLMSTSTKSISLPSGQLVPAFGLGTWRMGERATERNSELAALRLGLDLGVSVIDTAEMYGDGGAESIVGAAVAGRRDDVFIVSKLYPHHASAKGTVTACERSLKRLATDRIDLYLLHWRGGTPLAETVEAFARLQRDGKIRHWGVSNFDVDDLDELSDVAGGQGCAANQVLYHLGARGIEFDLLPDLAARKIPVMAYSPLGQGPLLNAPVVQAIAARHGVTPSAVALAWVLRQPNVMAIPKSVKPDHVRANLAALSLTLLPIDLAELDAAFPPPRRKMPLETT
jgi:diketogulonate reductase-like aldo/keto reductase